MSIPEPSGVLNVGRDIVKICEINQSGPMSFPTTMRLGAGGSRFWVAPAAAAEASGKHQK